MTKKSADVEVRCQKLESQNAQLLHPLAKSGAISEKDATALMT